MARQSQNRQQGVRKRQTADSKTPAITQGRNEGRKPDGGDDQGRSRRRGPNDDKGEGRGDPGSGKKGGAKKK
jgi:hypothetical protein